MTREVPIPQASLDRLRTAYGQFEHLSLVVAEAMGLPAGAVRQVSLPKGVFVVEDEPAAAAPPSEHTNGVAV